MAGDVISQMPYITNFATNGMMMDLAQRRFGHALADALGLAAAGGLGAAGGLVNMGLNIQNSVQDFRADAYYDMRQAGVSHGTANRLSLYSGLVQGLDESLWDPLSSTLLYGVTGGAVRTNLFIPVLRKIFGGEDWGNLLVMTGRYIIGEGLSEGFQEARESLTASFFQAMAEKMDGLPYSNSVKGAMGDAFDEGVNGFLVGAVLGAPGAISASRADLRSVNRLKDNAVTEFSGRAYVSSEENRETLSGMGFLGGEASEAQKDSILRKVWEDAAPGREKALKARADAVSGNGTASSEAIRRNQQEPERVSDGTIRHEAVETVRDSDGDGGVSYTVRFASKTARAEGGPATTYGTVKITVSKDGKAAEITDVSIEEPYLAAGAEMVRTAVMDYAPGAEVSWDIENGRPDLEAIKLAVVSSSPYGTLRFDGDSEAAAGLASVRNEILSVLSVSPDEATALAGLVSALAKAEGLSVEEFLGRHTPKGSLIQGKRQIRCSSTI